MTPILVVIIAVFAATLVGRAAYHLGSVRRRPVAVVARAGERRILFPFVASALSQRALDAALRLARAEDATLLPVFLARVPLTLPLDAPLPRQASVCLPLQEAIEHRAAAFGVPVDARVERGRSHRHALRRTMAAERFERIVMAAASDGGPGFGPDDVAWLLAHAPGEIVVLRPGPEDQLLPSPPRPRRRALNASAERVPVRA
jgi:nucleotide-binding universal stress UspA family protein